MFGRCSCRGGGEDQEGVDDQQAHPGHGHRDHHGDGGGEQGLLPEDADPAAVRQGRMDRGEHQVVEGQTPQGQDQQQDQASRPILPGSTERMSPMSRLLNLVRALPRVEMKMPSATAVEEKTPMTVSLAGRVRRRTKLKSRAKTREKRTAAQVARRSRKGHRWPCR